MECARLTLTARRRGRAPSIDRDRHRRYCQIRLANPNHEEDPRWKKESLERFRFDVYSNDLYQEIEFKSREEHNTMNELFLSVLNLKLPSTLHDEASKYPRQAFKYKNNPKLYSRHRLFIKQVVEDDESYKLSPSPVDSNITFDDYVKSILQNHNYSRRNPILSYEADDKSSHNHILDTNPKKNHLGKIEQYENDIKYKNSDKSVKERVNSQNIEYENNVSETCRIKYQKSAKRRSLVISRSQSPETIQVIRVDVVCNYSDDDSSSIFEENERNNQIEKHKSRNLESHNQEEDNKLCLSKTRMPRLYNKIVLANTIISPNTTRSRVENFSLFCKSFKFSVRSTKT